MTTVLHLPTGYPRTRRWNDAAGITHLAHRCWEALLAKLCEPTARAIAARYNVNKDTAAKALRSLVDSGLVKRWRRSLGRGMWLHFVLITDEPFAWLADAALAQKLLDVERDTVARAREHGHLDAEDALPPVPPPKPRPEPSPQPVSCPGSSDIPNKDSSKKIFTPTPRAVDNPRPPIDRYTQRLLRSRRNAPQLEPYTSQALAMMHDLGFAPAERVRHAQVVATALHSGRSVGAVLDYLTDGLQSARDRTAVLRWRLRRLHAAITPNTVHNHEGNP